VDSVGNFAPTWREVMVKTLKQGITFSAKMGVFPPNEGNTPIKVSASHQETCKYVLWSLFHEVRSITNLIGAASYSFHRKNVQLQGGSVTVPQ